MSHRPLSSISIIPAVFIAVVALSTPGVSQTQTGAAKAATPAQKTDAAKAPAGAKKPAASTTKWRTPWGEPDLQGVWNDATSTPLERPNGLTSNELTDAQADNFQDTLANDLSRDRRDGGPKPTSIAPITSTGWIHAG